MSEVLKTAILFEDLEDVRQLFSGTLEKIGWQVVACASNLQESFDLIARLSELQATIAFIDGNLGHSKDGADGREIAAELQKTHPEILRVGFSESPQQLGVNYQFGKRNRSEQNTRTFLEQIERDIKRR